MFVCLFPQRYKTLLYKQIYFVFLCKNFSNEQKYFVMNGSRLKSLVLSEGYTVAQIASLIGTSQQNLAAALKHDDIRSGLIEKVAKAMNKPLSFFYGETFGPVQSVGNNNTQVTQVAGDYSGAGPDVLELLKVKDEQLTLAMKQTSKAQEQMDRVLDRFCCSDLGGGRM